MPMTGTVLSEQPAAVSNTRYLVRFDDICPTMNWEVWSKVESALMERNIQPIMAVVADNQDPALQVHPPVESFWDRVLYWQSMGWSIGMHGYQHRYVSSFPGMLTARRKSEFAGLPAVEQQEKLQRATDIFRSHGIAPMIWIAPGHSFDASTVSLLPEFGVNIISDGHFRFPFVCPNKICWIPQQLSYFRSAPSGVWTVCHHINAWKQKTISEFMRDLDRYRPEIASVQEIVDRKQGRLAQPPWHWRRARLSPLLIRAQLKIWDLLEAFATTVSQPQQKHA